MFKPIILTASMLLATGLSHHAEASELLMPQFGYQTVQVTEPIDFYDMKGTADITSTSNNNSFSTVIFQPAAEGELVQITFHSVQVLNDGSTYPANLSIYNGTFDTSSVTYPTTTSDVSSLTVFPVNDNLLDRLDGTYSDLVYTSTTDDGALSVCFLYKFAKNCSGWEATVKSVKPTDMVINSVTADYTAMPESVYPGQKEVELGSVTVNAEGLKNLFDATSISFKLQNNDVIDPSAITLYAGTAKLATELSNNGDTYTLKFNRTLTSGDNKFTLKADILATAPFYNSLSMEFTGLTTTSSDTPAITGGSPVTATVAATVFITADPTTYYVDEKGFKFYDDGGPDNNITEKFNGQITFVPSVSGKKVAIDFTSLALFNTYEPNNDILNIYNGTEADPSKLLRTLSKETKALIHSTSEDGALTVTLKSVTGITKAGWEADVKLFEPQAMTLSDITTNAISTDNVTAGDKECAMLTLNISTENTEPALTLQSIGLGTSDTYAIIDKVKIYSTGNSAAFSTATLAGEAEVNSDDLTVNLTSPITLGEGDNYFHIVYEINVTAQNDNTVSARINKVTLSGNGYDIDDSATTATRTVKNICYATTGTKTQYVYGSIEFKNEPASSYSEGYTGDSVDRTVVFMPGNDGYVVEISEFTKFYFYSTYSGMASFAIYNGTSATGTPLFQLTTSNRNTIPDTPIRSTDESGALTVVFNAKGVGASTSSVYGWTATVSEYKLSPMQLSGTAEVTQTNTDIITCSPAQTNQELIGFNIGTTGSLDPLKLTEVVVNLKGCSEHIAKVYLTSSGTSNTLSINNVIGQGTPEEGSETVTIAPAREFNLSEGTNYFWINIDMKDGVGSDKVIDAKVEKIVIGLTDLTPEPNDPEGERITKNIYLLESGKGHEVPVGDESIMFYDDGGPDGKITRYFAGTVTFKPTHEGKAIKLNVKSLGLANGEKLNISYGTEVKTTPDAVIDYYSTAPMCVVALGDDGALTVDFSTNAYSQGDGWEIEVMEYELQPLSLGHVTIEAINDTEVLRGSETPLLKAAVTVDGDKGEFPFNNFTFSATDPALFTKTTLYATGTAEGLSMTNPIATADGFSLDCDYTVTLPGTYYFYLVGRVNPESNLESTSTVTAVSLTHQTDNTTAIESDAAATVKVIEGFSGRHTIGSSDEAEYTTFADAINAMSAGVEGAVVFEVEDGEYNELVKLDHIKGTSIDNNITFKSKSGNPENVIISSDNYSQPEYSDDRSFYEYGVLTVRGTDYVTFDGMTIKTSVTTFPSVVRIVDGTTHFTLSSCSVEAPMSVNSYSGGSTQLFTSYVQSNHNEQVNHHITLKDSKFKGGYIGANIGSGWVTVDPEEGALIEGCRFENNGSKAIYVLYGKDVTIKGNELVNTATTIANFYMLDLSVSGASRVSENKILQTAKVSATSYCFYLRNVTATADAPALIVNNECIIDADTKTSHGIYNTNAISNLNIAHNSFRTTGSNAYSSAIFLYKPMSGSIVNNVMQNEAGGYVFRYNTTNDVAHINDVTFANNHTYSSGSVFSYCYPAGDLDYATWTVNSGETDGINGKAAFESALSLRPSESGSLINGVKLSYVDTDIEGKQRAATPTIGAYEIEREAGNYTDGVFIVNEDWFGHSNSTVNFYSTDGEWTYRAFQLENPGISLGCTNQFGAIYGDRFYFISKQDQDGGEKERTGARVTVANAVTLQAIAQHKTIDPDGAKADGRGFLGVDEHKGYISTNTSIYVMNLYDNTITGKVTSDYSGETGTMTRVNDKVFAATLNGGILVIDPFTDRVTDVIDPASVTGISGAGAGSVVLAKDGNVYASVTTNSNGGAAKKIIRIAPATLECSVIDIPDEFYGPANSWYAWTPDGFCASTKENVLYWNGGASSWTSAQLMYKYEIDIDRVSKFIELESNVYLYGCSMRPHPVTDDIYMSVVKGGAWTNQTFLRKYKNDGTLISESTMEVYYWFPSLPVFPDINDPVATVYAPITVSGSETTEIDLSGIATDEDNMSAAMVKSLYENENPDVVEAQVTDGKLIVSPVEGRTGNTATIQVNVNSNGKNVIVPVPLTFATVGVESISDETGTIVKYIDGTLYVAGAEGNRVEVYNTAGALVADFTADSRKASIRLNLAKGVYVARIGNTSAKIVVK